MSVPLRKLGAAGLKSSAQGLGCMGMTAFYGKVEQAASETKALETIGAALSAGINHLDTAHLYRTVQDGVLMCNEDLVGKAVQKFGRESLVIATKTGIVVGKDGMKVSSAEEVIRAQLAESLSRLQTSYIDLYYLHRIDPKIPIEETMQLLKSFVQEGKIRYIGLSECTPDELRRAHAVHPVTSIQIEWSLFARDVEAELVPTARALGVGIVAYSPLGRGFLSNTFNKVDELDPKDFRRAQPRLIGDNFEKNDAARQKFFAIAHSKGCTPGQLALAWLHAQGEDVFPIPGTKSASRVLENAGAINVKLSAEEVKSLGDLFAQVHGDRYADMSSTYVSRVAKSSATAGGL